MRAFLYRHGVASLMAGVALGVGARLDMRVIARVSGLPGSFTVGGSFEVILFGALIGTLAAISFFALRRRVPIKSPWVGIGTGFGLFAVLALMPPSAAEGAMASTPDPPGVTAALFLSLFVCFGVWLDWYWQRYHFRSNG